MRLGKVPPRPRDPQLHPKMPPNLQAVGNLQSSLTVAEQLSDPTRALLGLDAEPVQYEQRHLPVAEVWCGARSIRYAWDPKERKLYFSPDTSPPDWMVEGVWRRLAALDMGAISELFEVPLKPPPAQKPSTVPPELELVQGARLDRLAITQGLKRGADGPGLLETDESLRTRINEAVRTTLNGA